MADFDDGSGSNTEFFEKNVNTNQEKFQQVNERMAIQEVDEFASSKLVNPNLESDSKAGLGDQSSTSEETLAIPGESGGAEHDSGEKTPAMFEESRSAENKSEDGEAPLVEGSTCNTETSTNVSQIPEPNVLSSTDANIVSNISGDIVRSTLECHESSANNSDSSDKDDSQLAKNNLSSPSENTSQRDERLNDTFIGSTGDGTTVISSSNPSRIDSSLTLESSSDVKEGSDDGNLAGDNTDLDVEKNGDEELVDHREELTQSDLNSSAASTETPNKVLDSSTDNHSPCSDTPTNADRTLLADDSVTETIIEDDDAKTPTAVGGAFSDVQSGSYSSDLSLSFEYDRPRDHCVKITLPNSQNCPVYALVLCSWDNIFGPHAQYVWQTEGKHNFTTDIMNYLSTHTLTSSDQPEDTVDTKMLILKDRGILVTSFLFSGYDKMEKTVFSLSLVVPYVDTQWYLPLHEFCVSRLSMMIGKLRVLQDKYKEQVGDKAVEAFNEDVPKFINVLTQLKMSSPGPRIQLNETVFAAGLEKTIDVQFTRLAIASHLQTCGCSIIVGKTVSEVNMMISTLAMFLSPAERRCCIYLNEGETRMYENDLYLQGFIKDTINLSECMRDIMTSSYPSTLVDMATLDVRQTLPFNKHAYWRHEVLCRQLQSLWLDSEDPMLYMPIVSFQNKCEPETLVQNFQREINLLHPHSGVREAYVEQYQRLLDRKAVGLIKYVEEETMKGCKTSRITVKKLKHDLDLNPEGNFRIILARAEKLKPGIYTIVCGNPATTREPLLQLDLSMSINN